MEFFLGSLVVFVRDFSVGRGKLIILNEYMNCKVNWLKTSSKDIPMTNYPVPPIDALHGEKF